MSSLHKMFAIAALSAVGLGAAVFAQEEFAPAEKPVPVDKSPDDGKPIPPGSKTFKDPNELEEKRQPVEDRPSDDDPANSKPVFGQRNAPGRQQLQRIERVVPVTRTVTEYVVQEMGPEEVKAVQGYQQAVAALKGAKRDADREKARVKLNEEVEKLFQRDLDQREKQVVEAETRVKKLRDQLEKRKAARKQIVDLRVQTLFNDASGLGFALPFEPVEGAAGASAYGGGGGSGNWIPPQMAPSYSKPSAPTPDPVPNVRQPIFKNPAPDAEKKSIPPGTNGESEDRNSTDSNSYTPPKPGTPESGSTIDAAPVR